MCKICKIPSARSIPSLGDFGQFSCLIALYFEPSKGSDIDMKSTTDTIQNATRQRVFAHVWLLLATVFAFLPAAGAPQIASAQDRAVTAPAAVSADASEEIAVSYTHLTLPTSDLV